MSDNTTVTVKILDKEYQVTCPAEEVDALNASARYLDRQMASIRDSGKVFGLDRIAVMAALNIANDYIRNRGNEAVLKESVSSLRLRVEQALAEHKQLQL